MGNDSVVPSPCSGSSGITILNELKCTLRRGGGEGGEAGFLTGVNLMAKAGQVRREGGDPTHRPPFDELSSAIQRNSASLFFSSAPVQGPCEQTGH